jgi:mRNA interferase HigB
VISKAAIRSFSQLYPVALEPLLHWYGVTKRAKWQTPADVRSDFGHAGFVGKYTVFNVAGNKYRLVAEIRYMYQIVYVRHILAHREYDRGRWKQ